MSNADIIRATTLTKALADLLKMAVDLIESRIEGSRENDCLKSMAEYAKKSLNGEVPKPMAVACLPIAYPALTRELEAHKIPYVKGFVIADKDNIDNNNHVAFFIRPEDYKKVTECIDRVKVAYSRQPYTTQQALAQKFPGEKFIKVSGLTPEQEYLLHDEMIRLQTDKTKDTAHFASERQEDGNYSVIFISKDKPICDKALQNVFMQTRVVRDNNGKVVSGFVAEERCLKAKHALDNMSKIASLKDDKSNTLYVVSSIHPDTYIKITPESAQFYRNGRPEGIAIAKTDIGYDDRIHELLNEMVHFEILTEKEFADKENIPEAIKKKQPKSYRNAEQHRMRNLEYKVWELIALKMTLDNSNQNETLSSLFNNEVSFSEFFEHELVNDENDKEREEKVQEGIELSKKLDSYPEDEREYAKAYITECYKSITSIQENSRNVPKAEIIQYTLDDALVRYAKIAKEVNVGNGIGAPAIEETQL